MKNVPIFIITFNRVRALRLLVDWLERAGHENIIFVDNGSTYGPLRDYLADTPHQAVFLKENYGAHVLWDRSAFPTLSADYILLEGLRRILEFGEYVVTDPDIVPTENCPLDLVQHLSTVLKQNPSYSKAGPGFYLDDLPEHCPRFGHECLLQSKEIGPGLHDSAIDTTFALYRPDWA